MPFRLNNQIGMSLQKRQDVGVLDLDELAMEFNYKNFEDMDISISPEGLRKRNPEKFDNHMREYFANPKFDY